MDSMSRAQEKGTFLYSHPAEVIIVLCLIFAVVIAGMLIYMMKLVQRYKSRYQYEEGYRILTDALVQTGLEYDFQKDRLRLMGERKGELDLPEVVDDVHQRLRNREVRLTLTVEEFDELRENAECGRTYQKEFQCRMKDGTWNWFNMIYTVVYDKESCKPVKLAGCLLDAQKQHQAQEKLVEIGQYDRLTGVYNRAGAEGQIIEALDHLGEYKQNVFLLMDVDRFKQMNDTYGHLCGDDVLKTIGQNMQEIFQGDTIICRWGGDEFLMFVRGPGAGRELVEKRIEELRSRMKQYQYEGKLYPVCLSIGGIIPCKGITLEKLFKQVDEVLYEVKKQGRDGYSIRDAVQE